MWLNLFLSGVGGASAEPPWPTMIRLVSSVGRRRLQWAELSGGGSGELTFVLGGAAVGQPDGHVGQQQLVVLVEAAELLQAAEGLLDSREMEVLVLNDETVFIVESKWRLQR